MRSAKEDTDMNMAWSEMFISHPKSGGPKATPIKRRLLYNEVIIPRCSRSTDPVISVFKQGEKQTSTYSA